jgi:2-polyprenyl-6-methoxyphenol hydroxylase-like FAD-dependent oxidoreductase
MKTEFDAAVVGAGPAGLVTAVVLARYGLDVLVADQRDQPSRSPRAVGITMRQMELLRSWGLEEQALAGAVDVELAVLETRTLTESSHGAVRDVGLPSRHQAAVVSPSFPARIAQDHLERVLLDHLDELPTAAVHRGDRVALLRQGGDGVALSVGKHTVNARFAVAADGGRSELRTALGIAMSGPAEVMIGHGVEIRADLWPIVGAHRYALYSITGSAPGVLIPTGGDRWQFGVVLQPGDDLAMLSNHDLLREHIRAAVGVPQLDVEIVRDNTFTSGAQLASSYSDGRVYLVGDAAHRVTPRGGNGLAMAVRDGLDLGWRLAWVLQGWAPEAFLSSYEYESRPVAADSVARAADPAGHCRSVLSEMQLDLGGRIAHAWVAPDVSTLDLIGPGLTLLTADDESRWSHAVATSASTVPIEVRSLPERAGRALGLGRPGGATLVRPDGVPVATWRSTPDPAQTIREALRAALSCPPQLSESERVQRTTRGSHPTSSTPNSTIHPSRKELS